MQMHVATDSSKRMSVYRLCGILDRTDTLSQSFKADVLFVQGQVKHGAQSFWSWFVLPGFPGEAPVPSERGLSRPSSTLEAISLRMPELGMPAGCWGILLSKGGTSITSAAARCMQSALA